VDSTDNNLAIGDLLGKITYYFDSFKKQVQILIFNWPIKKFFYKGEKAK
jgi:hypothetical protein